MNAWVVAPAAGAGGGHGDAVALNSSMMEGAS